MLEELRRKWWRPSSPSLELAMLFLISSMEICVHRLIWGSNFLTFYKAKLPHGLRFTAVDSCIPCKGQVLSLDIS